ncbi:MAG: hypothetical protein A3E82_06605 [Gammaproteobacteria bacterium RIFCSPHIGHO2_12_FULL_38_11]|nr:MAG: hypothetical protein A3E82_06605 [Gammaproteobacteria bacterium RIFCSPHIGHO2_12_FULL_38_11]
MLASSCAKPLAFFATPSQTMQINALSHALFKLIIPDVASNFISLEEFLDNDFYKNKNETKSKIDFLVQNGFPEVCAASYVYQDDAFHKKNIVVFYEIKNGQKVFTRVGRINFNSCLFDIRNELQQFDEKRTSVFKITPHDLTYFPCLRDSSPADWLTHYHGLSENPAYSSDEVRLFQEFDKNKTFYQNSYRLFLKKILVPDDTIKSISHFFILDLNFSGYVKENRINEKIKLKMALLSCAKFKKWFETFSDEDAHAIFREFSAYNENLKEEYKALRVDLLQVELCYRRFCAELGSEKIKNCFSDLSKLIASCRRGVLNNDHHLIAMTGTLTKLLGLQNCLLKITNEFLFDDDAFFLTNAELYVRKMNNVLCEFKKFNLLLESDQIKLLNDFESKMREAFKFINYDAFLQLDKSFVIDRHAVSVFFAPVPLLTHQDCVNGLLDWLRNVDNKTTVLQLFNYACSEHDRGNASWFSYSAWSSVRVTVYKPFASKINDAKNSKQLFGVIFAILAVEPAQLNALNVRFLLMLVNQFIAELSTKHIMLQFQNPGFSHFLQKQSMNYIHDDYALELMRLFSEALASISVSSDIEGHEWEGVEHFSEPVLD